MMEPTLPPLEADPPATAPGGRARRRRFFAAPHRRLTAVFAATILLGVSVAGVTLVQMGSAAAPINRIDQQLLHAANDLQASANALSGMTPTYLQALSLPAAQRSVLMASLAQPNARYQAAFDRYRQHAVGLPGERALQQQFFTASKASGDISVALLAPETLTVPQVAEAMSYNAKMAQVLDELRSMYDQQITSEVAAASSAQDHARTVLVLLGTGAFIVAVSAAFWIVGSLRRESHKADRQAARDELEARLQRAFAMAESEDDVYAAISAAIETTAPRAGVELLVADSSRAHLHQVVTSHVPPSGGCPVGSPHSCPAAAHGQTQWFPHSDNIDACPHLRHRPDGPHSATCVPVVITGQPMGVLHATGPADSPPGGRRVDAFELIARRAGERLTMLRTLARSEMQAHTDPLTGLLNRRSVENSARDLIEAGDPYTVAYADLDHFKTLNDLHGHDAGDRALRLFAHVLRDSIRPADLPARYGGEEFIVILPKCSPQDATAVMERVRANLETAIRDSDTPAFTVSVGIAASTGTTTFSETADEADHALLAAKAAGRDRIVVHTDPLVPDDPSSLTDA